MAKITIEIGTEEDFFQRGRQVARAADRGEPLPASDGSEIATETKASTKVLKLWHEPDEEINPPGRTA